MNVFKSIKTQLIIFLSALALVLAVKDRDPHFLYSLIITVLAAAAIESLIIFLKQKIFTVTESSLITGFIVGYVLASDNLWWKLLAACALAILSKHLIRFHGKHLFNPAGFGIFFATVLLQATTQWKATYLWYVLLPFGSYFIWKVRKLELLVSYAVVSLILFGGQALFQHAPFTGVFGYFSYFYIFIMLIEPKTTPVRRLGKMLFGSVVGVLIFVLTQAGAKFDVELCALLAGNLIVPLLNKLL